MTGIEHAQFDLMAYVQQKYLKAVWGAVEHILRNNIDNPIVGELTREKIKAAGIRSVFFSEEPPNLEFEKCDEKEVSCKFTSNLIGVAQGHWMISYNGTRRSLTDKEEAYLTAQEQLEDNHPVMEFVEDIIYCPSQIYFYFRTDGHVMCLYIRQRHGDTTARLVPCYQNGEFQNDSLWPDIELSRDYDIDGESYESVEAEEQEIIAIEKDCLARLRVMFPDVPFPQHPNRRRGRYGGRLPDVTL